MTEFITFNKSKKTGIIYNCKTKKIFKYAFEEKNLNQISNECKGYNWYTKNIKKKLSFASLKRLNKKVISATFPEITGMKLNYWDSVTKNYVHIKKVTRFYNKYWPKKKITGAHGDLTLSNIIYKNNNTIELIDWENFNKNEVWGYDICYFLISVISLPALVKKKNFFLTKDLDFFENLWKDFFKEEYIFSKNPVLFMKKRYNKYFQNRPKQEYYPNKLNNYLSSQISEITNKI